MSIRSTYRRLLNNLRLIPDSEIRSYYYYRCRSLANAVVDSTQYGPQGEAVEAPSRDPSRLLSKLEKEMRSVEEVIKGDTTKYRRMMDVTYARRGKRRWDFLDTIFPLSLQRPVIDISSGLARRSQPPSPYPAHIEPLVRKKKTMDNEPRASLKPPTPRLIANRLWEERSTEISKISLPLALRISVRKTGKNSEGKLDELHQRYLNRDEMEMLMVGLTKNEAQRLRRWFLLADRMVENLERLKGTTSYPPPPRVARIGRATSSDPEGSRVLKRPAGTSLAIPIRIMRRLYGRFVDELPVLIGSYQDPGQGKKTKQDGAVESIRPRVIKWRSLPGKSSVPEISVMSAEEAEWIV